MKKIIYSFFLMIAITNITKGQSLPHLDHPRGLYVDNFFYFNRGLSSPLTTQNTNLSILGNTIKENELLQYCSNNHITYITLYGIPALFTSYNGPNWTAYSTLLSNFICKAKRDYCIKKVGVALGVNGTPNDIDVVDPFNNIATPPTPPFIFQARERSLQYYDQLKFVEQTYLPSDPLYEVAEFTKAILRMTYFSDPIYNLTTSCPNNNIDVLNLEYEFWNPGGFYFHTSNGGVNLQDKISYMDQVKQIYNSGHSDKVYSEFYLGSLDDNPNNNSQTYDDHCLVAAWIDGMYNLTDRRVDRFVTTYYTSYLANIYNPGGLSNLDQNYEYRFADFCEENNTFNSLAQCTPIINTNNNTDIHPLFSAEDPFKGAEKPSVFLGNYLAGRSDQNITGVYSEQNIFSVEKTYFDDFKSDNTTLSVHSPTQGNDIRPGASQWFVSSQLVGFTDKPIIFNPFNSSDVLTSPVCASCLSTIDFRYQGPIESGINYMFTIKDGNNLSQTKVSGSASETGVTSDYNASGLLQLPSYNLHKSETPYIAEMILQYPEGCSYSYKQPILITDHPSIIVVNDENTYPSFGPVQICDGQNIILRASLTTGASYQWKINGVNISGATNREYSVTVDGIYTCSISGGSSASCNGISNPIQVNVKPNPFIFITVSCATPSSGTARLAVLPYSTPSTLPPIHTYWSTGVADASSIDVQVTDPEFFYVRVDYDGCYRNAEVRTTSDMLNGSNQTAPTITSPSQTTTCQTPINLTPANLHGASFYLWSDGSVSSSSMTAKKTGDYYLTTNNPSGCIVASLPTHLTIDNATFVNAGQTKTICSGSPVQLNGVVGGGANLSSIFWSGGIGTISNSTSAIAQYNSLSTDHGIIVFNLSANSTNSCPSASSSVTINFDNSAAANVAVSISSSPASPACSGIPITFTATPANGSVNNCPSYEWYLNGHLVGTNNNTFTTSELNSGDQVYCKLISDYACTNNNPATSNTITYTINSAPSVSFTGLPLNMCLGTSPVTLTGTPISGTFSGTGISGNIFDPSVAGPGQYNITYNFTGSNQCVGSSVNTVTITQPTPVITSITSTSFCQGGSVILDADVYNSYAWSSGETTEDITASTTGNYIVTVTDNYGCTGTSSISVTANSPSPTITTSGPTTFCQGGDVTLDAGVFASYLWSNNLISQSINVNSSGSYVVTVTDINGCTGSQTQVVNVNPLPVPTLTGQSSVCKNQTVTYNTDLNQPNYLWTWTGGTLINGGGNNDNFITINWTTVGNGIVHINYTDVNGCTANTSTDLPITINPLPSPTITGLGNVCVNQTNVTYTTQGGQPSYNWTYTGGTLVSGGGIHDNSITLNWGAGTTGHVIVNYTNNFGCSAANPFDETVTIHALPLPIITGSTSVCANQANVNVTYSTAAGQTNYNWTYSGGTLVSGGGVNDNSITINWGGAGTGHVKVNYTDQFGCSALTQVDYPITILQQTTATFNLTSDFSGNDQEINCDPGSITNLTISNCTDCGSNPQVQWYYVNQGGTHILYTTTTGASWNTTAVANVDCGWQYFYATVTPSNDICPSGSVTSAQHIQVGSFTTVNPNITCIASVTNTTCPNSSDGSISVGLNYPGYNQPSFASLTWTGPSNGNHNFNPGPYPTHFLISGLQVGQYHITIDMYSFNVTVLSTNLNPTPVISNGYPGFTCSPNLSTSLFSNYQWLNSGASILGTNQNFTPSSSGTYAVLVTDQNGCTGLSTPQVVDLNVDATISGLHATCGTNYSVPVNNNNAVYNWALPVGATYTPQNSNSITVNWGNAYSTGGIISCTVTDQCGITATNSITVLPLIVSATSSPSCVGVNNGTAGVNTLIGGTTPYTYHWNAGTATTSAIMTNLSAGTYTVTVTDHNNCTATASTTVSNLPTNIPTPQISGTSSASPGAHTYSITNFNATYNNYYSWNPIPNSGNVTISYPNGDNQTASITWPSSGGKIVVTFGIAGCLQTTTYYVQPYCQNTFTYSDGDNQSQIISAPIYSITHLNSMSFNGIFNITHDFTFLNCGQVSFAPGAKILVHSGNTLTIDNCSFGPGNGCCKMWKGIELESGAHIIIKNGSYISEAECGLLVNDHSTYNITYAHFRNNYVGIQIGNGSSIDITGSFMSSTEFYSDQYSCGGSTFSPFVDKYDGQTTQPDVTPLAGISISNCPYFKIGTTPNVNGGDLRFYNLSNGILAYNSSLYISNTTFKNIQPDPQYPISLASFNGSGISANLCYVELLGLGGDYNSDYTVENCKFGFSLSNCNASISYVNTNSNTSYGSYLTYSRNVHLYSSCWQCNRIGVLTYHNPGSTITIDKSDFRMSTTDPSAACIRNDEFQQNAGITIKDNTMRLNLARYGIINYGLNSGIIQQNSVEMNDNINSIGILCNAGQNNTYKCNTVFALQTYSNPQTGISVNQSRGTALICNWINRQQNGINFSGACNDTRLQGNSFNDHNIGLGLYYYPNIGQQYYYGNTWDGTCMNYGAFLSQIDQNLANTNQFDFRASNGTNNYPSVTNDNSGFQWFSSGVDQADFSCSNFDCQPVIPNDEIIQESDNIIAQLNPTGNDIQQTNGYLADKFLYEKLNGNPDLLLNNPILEAFYNQQENGSIGLYTNMQDDINSAVQWESVYDEVYSTNETMIINTTDSIHYLDSLLQMDPANSTLSDQISTLNGDIESLNQSNQNLLQTINQIRDYRAANAIYGNSNLPSDEDYEYNQQVINDIYLNTLAVGVTTFTSDQVTNIQDIMEKCPFTGGPAVYTARSLYSSIDNSIDWNDNAICIASGVSPRIGRPHNKVINSYILYPNPTTGMVSLNYKLASTEVGFIDITSMLGVSVSETKLNSDNQKADINLSNLKPAIYYYKIIVDGNEVKHGMISIIR